MTPATRAKAKRGKATRGKAKRGKAKRAKTKRVKVAREARRTKRPRRPPARQSDEADREQLRLAQREGRAYGASLRYMVQDVADAGGSARAGDYVVAFAQEKAEGMYHLDAPGRLEWMDPAEGENCHLEISVTDATDGRFIPALDIAAVLIAEGGEQVGPFAIPFVWHPGLYHYGKNLKVPGDGRYTLRVRIEAPRFHRHDEINGKRYADVVEVEFPGVEVRAGRE